jgi:peptidoglycan/xylan/chitin deacetylase (PgdA/CDA1 family)
MAVPAAAQTRWPNGAKAAVVLTYDDALESQLDHAIPALDAAGLKGTFFLANVKESDVDRWRAAARHGHELANHTIFHPCTHDVYPADPRYVSEAYTSASMLREIAQQNVLLRALDGKDRHGFATPCGQSLAGGKDYLEDLRKAGIVTYVRGVVDTPADARADVARADPMHIPARGFGEGATAAKMIAYAREAEQGRDWAVFLFHGVGGDYQAVPDAEHRAFVAWLAQHRSEVWVTTLQGALDWVKAHPVR